MLAIVPSSTLHGITGQPVSVEVHTAGGLPSFSVVGQPDATCREARDRVRAALLSSGFRWPDRRITVNLAPSGFRKVGAVLDLPIALGVLIASDQLDPQLIEATAFLGELGLDGAVRSVSGMLPMVDALTAERVVVPPENSAEAQLVGRHEICVAESLGAVVSALLGEGEWPGTDPPPASPDELRVPDLADVRGQLIARRALEIAAAGGHHLLLIGPPGAGKTMLARRLPGLLPDLDTDLALVTTRIHSAAGSALPHGGLIRTPPFRAPHHGASSVSLVGGGSTVMRPGEISCAHGGVLFLDEMGEFAPVALDALRQPLEEGVVRVTRAAAAVTYPARFLLVAAMNPCPCGEYGGPGQCQCSDGARLRYARRLSGPLLDRFDLRVAVDRPGPAELLGQEPGEATSVVAERVELARDRARRRGVEANGRLAPDALDEAAPLMSESTALLERALVDHRLSGRGLHRVRSVALTIADLEGVDPPLEPRQIALALALRIRPAGTERTTAMSYVRP